MTMCTISIFSKRQGFGNPKIELEIFTLFTIMFYHRSSPHYSKNNLPYPITPYPPPPPPHGIIADAKPGSFPLQLCRLE